MKHLAVIFDNKLKFEKHINDKIKRTMHALDN